MRPTHADRASGRLGALRRALALAAFAACACSRNEPAPNLVIVTLDTTRADHLGLYGYFRDTSPVLDAFAGEAIVFDRLIVPMATTLPTHTSLFTATHPLEHGVLANSRQGGKRFVPTPRLRPLAEVAHSAGWRTAAFVSAVPLKRGSGIEAGFEHFDEPADAHRDAERTTRAALAWLEQIGEEPFLLWVHYYDAHWLYAPPPPYATMFRTDARVEAMIEERRIPTRVLRPLVKEVEDTRTSIDLYDGELRYQDAWLGELLAALKGRPDWDRTVVVIVGDHGEGLGQHGEAAHGGTWNEQLHSPLLMRIPGEPPRRVAALLAAADVVPTLLGRLELPVFEPLLAQSSGQDVLAEGSRDAVTGQDTGRLEGAGGYRYALTTQRWKLFQIQHQGGEVRHLLFDLEADPFELTDVAPNHPEVVARLAAQLEDLLARQRERGLSLREGEALPASPADPRLQEQLEALGYVVDDAPAR
jgi:arylsulfatase